MYNKSHPMTDSFVVQQ